MCVPGCLGEGHKQASNPWGGGQGQPCHWKCHTIKESSAKYTYAPTGATVSCLFLEEIKNEPLFAVKARLSQVACSYSYRPVATGHRPRVVRASKQCTSCSAGSLSDERHLVFECAPLAAIRAKYSDLFTATTHTMRSFFAQREHLGVFHYDIDCLNIINA